MNCSTVFITAAANTVAQAVAWFTLHPKVDDSAEPLSDQVGKLPSQQDFLAYACSNSVAMVDVESKSVLFTLPLTKEESRVNAICYTYSTSAKDEVLLIAGGDKGFLHLWRVCLTPSGLKVHFLQSLCMEGKAVTYLSANYGTSGAGRVVLAAIDISGALMVWVWNKSTVDLIKREQFHPSQLPNTIHISTLDAKQDLLAVGAVDGRLYLFLIGEKEMVAAGHLSGHEDWISCLTSHSLPSTSLFLASGSHDSKIRLWKILPLSSSSSVAVEAANAEDDEDEDLCEQEGDEEGEQVPPPIVDDETAHRHEVRLHFQTSEGVRYGVYLEALLVGHEDAVTSLHALAANPLCPSPFTLFSTSMDRNMILWGETLSGGFGEGQWLPGVRVGDLGGALGGCVGGNLLGFTSGCPSPHSASILGIGFGGSFHLWQQESSKTDEKQRESRWMPRSFLSGHFDEVTDLTWTSVESSSSSRGSGLLVSVSKDMTCRAFAPLVRPTGDKDHWVEVSRPQIHGHALHAIAALHPPGCDLITAGEEKALRVFSMPNGVRRGLLKLCGLTISGESLVEKAFLPELGLSNKGSENMTEEEKREQENRGVLGMDWTSPPLESQLADLTLWPESRQLFGHNNDVLAVAISADGRFLASSSKARYGAACVMLLWRQRTQIGDYEALGQLSGHESTVVCLAFSPSGKFLATSGKDRRLAVFRYVQSPDDRYVPFVVLANSHKRIVWDLSWTFTEEERLVTGSRDGQIKVWAVQQDSSSGLLNCLTSTAPFGGGSVTAVSCCPQLLDGKVLLALGGESGELQLWSLDEGHGKEDVQVERVNALSSGQHHTKAVARIAWYPRRSQNDDGGSHWDWASAGADHTVRLHRLHLTTH